jgi:hypothetical protein
MMASLQIGKLLLRQQRSAGDRAPVQPY